MTTNTPTDPLVEALKKIATYSECVGNPRYGFEVLQRKAAKALEAHSRRVPAEAVEPDCPIKINDGRRWLARNLMDSKLSDKEALGIVAYHPDIKDHWSNAAPATPPAPDLEGVRAALAKIDAVEKTCPIRRSPKNLDQCPDCGATSDQGCGRYDHAAYAFIEVSRQALATLQPNQLSGSVGAPLDSNPKAPAHSELEPDD